MNLYGLHGPDGKVRYIGITRFPVEKRLRQHQNAARAGNQRPVYDWMRDVGPEHVQLRPLSQHESLDELAAAERNAIRSLPGLLNVSTGGGTGPREPCQHGAARTACKPCRQARYRLNGDALRQASLNRYYEKIRPPDRPHRPYRPRVEMTESWVDRLFLLSEQGKCYAEIGRIVQVSAGTVSKILRGVYDGKRTSDPRAFRNIVAG